MRHEYVRTLVSYERAEDGVVFSCATSEGRSVEISLSVCSPEVLRVRMCPDPALREVEGLLEIKQDWTPSPFTLTETAEHVNGLGTPAGV